MIATNETAVTSERAFFGVVAMLFGISAAATVAWCGSMSGMDEMSMPGGWTMSMAWMRMPGQTWLGAAAAFLGMWLMMMIAMMLPSLVPMLRRYRRAVGSAALHPASTTATTSTTLHLASTTATTSTTLHLASTTATTSAALHLASTTATTSAALHPASTTDTTSTALHPASTTNLTTSAALGRLGWLTGLAGAGYFFVWTIFGIAAFLLGAGLAAITMEFPTLARAVPFAVGGVVLAAGVVQLTSWKAHHLACCREATPCSRSPSADVSTAWRHGLRLGIQCIYCCANLMVIPLVMGVMDLRAMAVVTAAITLERLAPGGESTARAIGVVVVGAGLFLIAQGSGLI
jgi:predicted metal-binding membrane protein